ncbi:tetratricopeptide repeat protein, partial [Ectothiorhodospira lacustris]|uniref:tetratricopeptide repeat protein n=1 Tax=Ectothiorhodospira lacustris TaxID=2899127 RepID=UPI001EE852A4
MHEVTLDTAEQLTGLSRRSLRRRLGIGMMRQARLANLGRGYVPLACIREDIPTTLTPDDEEVIVRADRGDAEAQNDVALLFMEVERYDLALPWLRKAAAQEYPDAMHWLGRCYVSGHGVEKDEAQGLEWLRRAGGGGTCFYPAAAGESGRQFGAKPGG